MRARCDRAGLTSAAGKARIYGSAATHAEARIVPTRYDDVPPAGWRAFEIPMLLRELFGHWCALRLWGEHTAEQLADFLDIGSSGS